MPTSVVCQGLLLYLGVNSTDFDIQANSVDPDQTAPLGAVWSGSTLIATESQLAAEGLNDTNNEISF